MLIGAMNHPAQPVEDEIARMAALGMQFIDLTLEPPAAASWLVDRESIRAALERSRLGIVGHTAYYLPVASPIPQVRRAAVEEFRRCMEIFASLGAGWMNLHPDRNAPLHGQEFVARMNVESIRELLPLARHLGVGIMIENLPSGFNSVRELAALLDPLPEVGFHLDIGHANLLSEPGNAEELIRVYAPRIRHVHLHDNKLGSADLHLPLGAGKIDIAGQVAALKRSGYDGTITLEVFTPDLHYLGYSAEVLRRMWDAA
jgi:sugar phosphate isomerase/epimerase